MSHVIRDKFVNLLPVYKKREPSVVSHAGMCPAPHMTWKSPKREPLVMSRSHVIRDKALQLLNRDVLAMGAGSDGAGSAATGAGGLMSAGSLASEALEPVDFLRGKRRKVRGEGGKEGGAPPPTASGEDGGGGGGGGGDMGGAGGDGMTLPAPHPLKQHGRWRVDKRLASCVPPHTRKGIVKGALCLRPMITGSESPAG